ncbi:MAG: DUF429 domain-containing protein [Helicobacteraceae bacterium]|nr:DUF429 domain-containing protein [Candidatus Sulfurimonas ponti]MBL6972952.1 DUF429 domain-containing protein [Sulfurimonas sp.]
MDIYIGIDLAWGEKNLSGFCVLISHPKSKSLKILDIQLLKSIDEIVKEIQKYEEHKVYVGVDAPLVVPNESGNREIEKNFNKDFAKYKISMLPANRKILKKHSPNIRSEELYKKLVASGFKRDFKNDKVLFEVYPNATIAMLFNNHKILPYKRKKGRNTEFIREQLDIYKKYLSKVVSAHPLLKVDIRECKGQKLKDYEDTLDSLVCGYSMYHCRFNEARFYQVEGNDTFVTPVSSWKVYMLQCSDDTLYTGVTTNLQRRVQEHNTSNVGAKYTKVRRPVKLVYFENADGKVHAMQREYAIKQLSRKEKLELISTSP